MPIFRSKHGEALSRILSVYQQGVGLIGALETYVKSAEDAARSAAADEVALTCCEGLHDGPPSGLKCLACYEAEMGVRYRMQVDAEMEAAREKKD